MVNQGRRVRRASTAAIELRPGFSAPAGRVGIEAPGPATFPGVHGRRAVGWVAALLAAGSLSGCGEQCPAGCPGTAFFLVASPDGGPVLGARARFAAGGGSPREWTCGAASNANGETWCQWTPDTLYADGTDLIRVSAPGYQST